MAQEETKQKQKRPSNYEVAVYLAEAHREKMVNDEAFKKVAAKFNLKWRVLIRKEIARRQSFIHDALIGQSPEDLERHWRLMGAQDAFKGMLQFIDENNQK